MVNSASAAVLPLWIFGQITLVSISLYCWKVFVDAHVALTWSFFLSYFNCYHCICCCPCFLSPMVSFRCISLTILLHFVLWGECVYSILRFHSRCYFDFLSCLFKLFHCGSFIGHAEHKWHSLLNLSFVSFVDNSRYGYRSLCFHLWCHFYLTLFMLSFEVSVHQLTSISVLYSVCVLPCAWMCLLSMSCCVVFLQLTHWDNLLCSLWCVMWRLCENS